MRSANFPPITAWKVSNALGSFSFSRSSLSLVCFGLLILFRRRWKIIISKSWSFPMSAPGEKFVFWQCSLLIGSASSPDSSLISCPTIHKLSVLHFWECGTMTRNVVKRLPNQNRVNCLFDMIGQSDGLSFYGTEKKERRMQDVVQFRP